MLASPRHPRRGLSALAGLVLALALSPSLDASVVIPATLDELAGEADLIVHARVARVDTRQAPGTLRVERVVTLAVVRALKGSPGEALQLVLPGGTFGRYRTVVPGVPEIAEGEEAVLFLRPSPTGATHLVGFSQGVLRVRIDPIDGAADGRRPRHVGDRRTGRARGHRSRTAAAGDDRGAHRAGGPRPAAGAPVRRAALRHRGARRPRHRARRRLHALRAHHQRDQHGPALAGRHSVSRQRRRAGRRHQRRRARSGAAAGLPAPGRVSPRQTSGSRARASRRAGPATTTPATSSASSGAPISSGRWPSRATPST